MKGDTLILSQIYGIITQEVDDLARVRSKEWSIAAGITAGWNIGHKKLVWDEDVYLIGAGIGPCPSGTAQAYAVRFGKGVSDPSVDVGPNDDVYFVLTGAIGASAAGHPGHASSCMLPEGYYFPINEDEPVFMDVFSDLDAQGGHVILYYVLKREWKK